MTYPNAPDNSRRTLLATSTLRRLLQVALTATVLIPLSSRPAEAAPMTFQCFTEIGTCTGEGATGFWGFETESDSYYFQLEFILNPGADFTVDVEANPINPERSFGALPEEYEYECLPLTEDEGCVEFEVTVTDGEVGEWSHYFVEVGWDYKPESVGEGYDPFRMTLLHDKDETGMGYDFDVCATPGLYDVCQNDGDPLIRSGNTAFSVFAPYLRDVAVHPVPEPGSLALLSAGLAGVAFRRRSR